MSMKATIRTIPGYSSCALEVMAHVPNSNDKYPRAICTVSVRFLPHLGRDSKSLPHVGVNWPAIGTADPNVAMLYGTAIADASVLAVRVKSRVEAAMLRRDVEVDILMERLADVYNGSSLEEAMAGMTEGLWRKEEENDD